MNPVGRDALSSVTQLGRTMFAVITAFAVLSATQAPATAQTSRYQSPSGPTINPIMNYSWSLEQV